jgi:diguanylate cyclase (GGDEF)-like protein
MTEEHTRPSILVVEDDANARTALAELLEHLGHEVVTACDGLSGLELARTGSFDLVITDLRMPRLDGLAMIAKLRELAAHADTPIVLLSALNDPVQRASALDLGADDFLSKPVVLDELLARVRLHLRHGSRSRELRDRAVVDELTGVLNRRGSRDLLERELRRVERSGAPLTALLIDIDGFKAINDERGHASGDRVLKQVARNLALDIRAHDRVGRWGGDEFIVILPETDALEARQLVHRLRAAVLPVRISIGAATAQAADSVESMLDRADAAMYVDKASRASESMRSGTTRTA